MNIRNILYKQYYRSRDNFQLRDQNEHQEKQYRKQLQAIENSLSMMNTAFKNSIKIQQIYMDLIKARTKKLNFKQKDIRNVYKILSQNKTGEIFFLQAYDKDQDERKENTLMVSTKREETGFMTNSLTSSRFKELSATFSGNINHQKQKKQTLSANFTGQKIKFKSTPKSQLQNNASKIMNTEGQDVNDSLNSCIGHCFQMLMLTYRRLYSRLVQATVKKLTYYILNKQVLQKIILHTVSELSKKLQILIRRIFDFRDFKFLYDAIKLIYEENFILQQKIYELLVDEGHIISIEEFFRINGIMMEENQVTKRRSSRMSVMSIQRLSLLANQPICLDELKVDSKPKQSRFSPQNKKLLNKKDKIHSTQKPNLKNLHAEKINKQIESKYASALDKLGDLIEKSNQDLALLQQNNIQMPKQADDELSRIKKSQHNEDFGLEGFVRSKSKKKSTQIKRKHSNFQYFSSSFKEIIKDLDEKKGRTSQFVTQSRQEKQVKQGRQGRTDSLMFKGGSSILQPIQFQKINNETICLQNPTNVARLLSKKFKTLMPHASNQRNRYSLIDKKMRSTSSSNGYNPIGKLLKIYQNKNKQSHVIEILFGTNFEDQDQKSLQKNFVKLSVMAKLKEKKIEKMKGNQIECAKFQDYMIKEIQHQYEQLLAMRRQNNKSKIKGAGFQSQIQKDTSRDGNINQKSSQTKRNTVNEEMAKQETPEDVSKKQDQDTFFKTQIQTQEPNQFSLEYKNSSLNQSNSQLKNLQSTYRTFRTTHQPNFSQTQMALASHLKTFQCFEANQFKKFQTAYGEFTNPLTKTTGYYNQKDYKSLRSSLEKREANSIIKLKRKVENQNLFEIGSSVSFWNTIRKTQQKSCDKLTNRVDLERVQEQNAQEEQKDIIKQSNVLTAEKSTGVNLFQHQVLKKFLKWQKQNHPDGQQIIKPTKIKAQRPQQLKILRLQHSKHSRTERGSLKKIDSLLKNIRQDKYNNATASKQLSQKLSSKQLNALDREFCLNAKKIQKPKLQLNQDELGVFIEKYLKGNKKIETSYANNSKINESFVIKDFSKAINSMPVSPRHSFKKIKELYSTHRRTKVQ